MSTEQLFYFSLKLRLGINQIYATGTLHLVFSRHRLTLDTLVLTTSLIIFIMTYFSPRQIVEPNQLKIGFNTRKRIALFVMN